VIIRRSDHPPQAHLVSGLRRCQYHFFNDSRWKPYLGAGVRYVDANAEFRDLGARISPEINGGVSFMMTPNLSLRFDGRVAVRSNVAGIRPAHARGRSASAVAISDHVIASARSGQVGEPPSSGLPPGNACSCGD
jgi:hypothetical protein